MFSRRSTTDKYLAALENTSLIKSAMGGSFPSQEGSTMETRDLELESNDVVTRAEFDDMRQKIDEMHKFVAGIANALNNPMLKAMLPPQMRDLM